MKFSFVVPTINQFQMLFECVDSLRKYHDSRHEIIVVEDGSQPGVQNMVLAECERRGIKCIRHPKNMGFAHTVNDGIRAATGDVVVLVNNDVIFTRETTEGFERAFAANPRVGVVGGLLFYPNGTIQHGGVIAVGKGTFTHRGWHKHVSQAPEVLKSGYLLSVTGALFAIKREMFQEIGLLNENYFLSCEDTEYCLRAWDRGWRVYYEVTVQAIHAEGGTRGNNDKDKLVKSREWYIKERQTFTKFHEDVKKLNWDELQARVGRANLEITGEKPPEQKTSPLEIRCDRKVYGKTMTVQMSGQQSEPKKIIAVRRTAALGDVLLTTPIIRKLKEMNPDREIWVATFCPDVFAGNPNVTRVVRTLEEIPSPDQVIDLDLAYEKNPKTLVTKAYAEIAFGNSDFNLTPEMFSDNSHYSTLKLKMGSFDPEKNKVAVVHAGVGWPSRTWARQNWNEVSRLLASMGYKVVMIGKGQDFRSDLYPGVLNLIDHCSIHEIRELMKRASVFIGMDSGMFHVAMTTDVPSIGIFTVADPDFRVSPRDAKTIALAPKVGCRFCLHDQKPPVTFVACKFGTNHCLNDFTPHAVVEAVKEIAR